MSDISKATQSEVWLVTAGGEVEWETFRLRRYAEKFYKECQENGWEDAKIEKLCSANERDELLAKVERLTDERAEMIEAISGLVRAVNSRDAAVCSPDPRSLQDAVSRVQSAMERASAILSKVQS